MKVEILLDGNVINTQIVSEATYAVKPTLRDAKRLALKAALADRVIQPSHALRARFRVFDVTGHKIDG
ncbi:MAG: hypothetical protein ABI216_03130 [Devosia sp.]